MPDNARNLGPDAFVASEQLATWRHAVQVQVLRILGDGAMGYTGPFTRQVDVYLLALALRNLIRAAYMVKSALDAPLATQALAALSDFDAAVPRATDVRDVLEHFDEYLSGSGKLQRRAGSSAPVTIWHEIEHQRHTLRLGVAPGQVLSIDVAAVSEAAPALANRLAALVQQQHENQSIKRTVAAARAQRTTEESLPQDGPPHTA